MHLTYREWWAVVHGMGLGALFLLAFGGVWPACTACAPGCCRSGAS
jgi:hypothetical protein